MALITCSECKAEISDKSVACVRCGAPVAEQIKNTLVKNTLMATTGLCPNCKSINQLDAHKCFECGMRFGGESSWKLKPHGSNPLPQYNGSYEPSKSNNQEPRHQLVKHAKSRGVFVILGLFFGLLGVHNFYIGRFGVGAAQLLITCILGWFIVGLVITAIWSVADLFMVTTDGSGDALA